MGKLVKDVLLVVAALTILIVASCDEGEFVEPFDPNLQFAQDLITIETYIVERGLDPVDTTTSSVRYAITEQGTGDPVEVDDVVTIDFTAYLAATGRMLQTSLQSVADTSESISSAIDPLVFRHTINGWGLNDVFSQRGGATATNGFRDGLTAALNVGHPDLQGVGTDGTMTVLIPTQEILVTIDGATNRPQGFPNEVVAYEISVRHVRR